MSWWQCERAMASTSSFFESGRKRQARAHPLGMRARVHQQPCPSSSTSHALAPMSLSDSDWQFSWGMIYGGQAVPFDGCNRRDGAFVVGIALKPLAACSVGLARRIPFNLFFGGGVGLCPCHHVQQRFSTAVTGSTRRALRTL